MRIDRQADDLRRVRLESRLQATGAQAGRVEIAILNLHILFLALSIRHADSDGRRLVTSHPFCRL